MLLDADFSLSYKHAASKFPDFGASVVMGRLLAIFHGNTSNKKRPVADKIGAGS